MLLDETQQRRIREDAAEKEKVEQMRKLVNEVSVLGCDLGQSRDFSAFVLVSRVKITTFDKWVDAPPSQKIDIARPFSSLQATYKDDVQYHCRLIERARLSTSYAEIVRYMKEIVERPEVAQLKNLSLAVDASGVGRAIVDLLRDVGVKNVIAITATGGEAIHEDSDGEAYTVPKTWLVSLVKSLMAKGILKINKNLKDAPALIHELDVFMVKRSSDTGKLQFEAAPSAHDDLVSALCLACLLADLTEAAPPLIAPIEIKRDFGDGLRAGPRISRGAYDMSNRSRFY